MSTSDVINQTPSPDVGWAGRKAIAIPMALWCATAQALYHLGCMVILGIGNAYWDNGALFSAYKGCISKDYQEAYGWLTALFCDSYGLQHIMEAQSDRTSYFQASIPKTIAAPIQAPSRYSHLIVENPKAYKKHVTGTGHPERPERVEVIGDALWDAGLMDQSNTLEPRPATKEQVLAVHGSDYYNIVYGEVKLQDQLSTGDVKISPKSLETALLAAGGVLTAIDAVMEGKTHTAFCVIRPPGHHASQHIGRGFCIFNNVAVGARYLQQTYGIGRVLIVDWDAHHGDGTQAIFENDPSVFYFSTHTSGIYPGTGFANETGVGNICNCPIAPTDHSDQDILAAFKERLVPAMETFQPEFIFISCGFDALATDPLGQLNLTPESFAELTRVVKEIGQKYSQGRIISCLEGGYDLNGIGAAAVAHVNALKD